MYLLDSNVCIQFLRGKNVLVRQRLKSVPTHEVQVCSIVLAELFIGCLRSVDPVSNRAKVDTFLWPYAVLPFDEAAADIHARIRWHLGSLGQGIGPYDTQIAAIALANGATLVTHNTGEFKRVPGLAIEDWELP